MVLKSNRGASAAINISHNDFPQSKPLSVIFTTASSQSFITLCSILQPHLLPVLFQSVILFDVCSHRITSNMNSRVTSNTSSASKTLYSTNYALFSVLLWTGGVLEDEKTGCGLVYEEKLKQLVIVSHIVITFEASRLIFIVYCT